MINDFNWWQWEEFYDKKQIKTIHDKIQKTYSGMEPTDLPAGQYEDGTDRKVVDVQMVSYESIVPEIYRIIDEAYVSCNENFGYDVIRPTMIDTLLYNTYTAKSKSKYDYHVDVANNPHYDIKMTLLVNLSPKEFEGGDFYLYQQEDILVPELKKPGSAILIKSAMNHKVTPITKGTRRTLTFFMKGPAWK